MENKFNVAQTQNGKSAVKQVKQEFGNENSMSPRKIRPSYSQLLENLRKTKLALRKSENQRKSEKEKMEKQLLEAYASNSFLKSLHAKKLKEVEDKLEKTEKELEKAKEVVSNMRNTLFQQQKSTREVIVKQNLISGKLLMDLKRQKEEVEEAEQFQLRDKKTLNALWRDLKEMKTEDNKKQHEIEKLEKELIAQKKNMEVSQQELVDRHREEIREAQRGANILQSLLQQKEEVLEFNSIKINKLEQELKTRNEEFVEKVRRINAINAILNNGTVL
ncbi:hypothetical protein GCK72_015176 [Caenorhabditis remanei]|uniref:Uncharacterized protein n=1 Tax=Caenorhabditis remanei TaxID=31234 RepID=A0A6A5GVT6_CAERE|nr:hypothetical protein GCK72_015176 [Caenorhabditis remanei]KAF1758716.1 hypothetical protein GCK72_015176 [Caenorhabditis remanei]